MSAGRCRDCQADIVWARTQAGKLMPLDPERRPDGDPAANVAVSRDHLGRVLARVLKPTEDDRAEPFEWLAVPHFATCVPRLAREGRVEGVASLDRARKQRGRTS